MEIVFAYLAGLLTLINPCVLPVLPHRSGDGLAGQQMGPPGLGGGDERDVYRAGHRHFSLRSGVGDQ